MRNWFLELVAAAVFGGTLMLAFVFTSLANFVKNTERSYSSAVQQYQDSKRITPLGAVPQRRQTDPKAYQEEWRDEQDLRAQRNMADWTFWMLVATSVGTVVTFFGIYFVAKTLTESRRTNQITLNAFAHERRAWMKGKNVHEGKVFFDSYSVRTDSHLVFQNVGQSPATSVAIESEIFRVLHANEDGTESLYDIKSRTPSIWTKGDVVFPNDVTPTIPNASCKLRHTPNKPPNKIYVKFTCSYCDGLSNEKRVTSYCYILGLGGWEDGALDTSASYSLFVLECVELPNSREIS